MNEREWEITCNAIAEQRNNALNQVAGLTSQLATMADTVTRLTEELAKATKEKDPN